MFFKRFTKGKSARVSLPSEPDASTTVTTAEDGALRGLSADQLRRTLDAASLGFKTTADLTPAAGPIGQERALKAIDFGLAIPALDFNIFVLGPRGAGKRTAVAAHLAKVAAGADRPSDWVYVHNFKDPRRPRALKLPAGRGKALALGVEKALGEIAATLPAAFEAEDYLARRRAIDEAYRSSQDDALDALQLRAERQNIAILRTPLGFGMAPMHEGRAVRPEVFSQLPDAMRRDVEARIALLEAELEAILAHAPEAAKLKRRQIETLDADTARPVVEAGLDEVSKAFADVAEAAAFLADAETDLVQRAALLATPSAADRAGGGDTRLQRYAVNVICAQPDDQPGAPVYEEFNPTAASLAGRIEYSGDTHRDCATDFTMIRGGALHRANGGALLIDARRLIAQPAAWECLKRALIRGQISIDPGAEKSDAALSVATIEPDPIPLLIKVVLLGEPDLYYQLADSDPDFMRLFKVQADFDETIAWTTDHEKAYAGLIASIVETHQLKPVAVAGVARLIEEAARFAEDREKLSIEVGRIADIVREADFWSASSGRTTTSAKDVARALEERVKRADRLRAQVQEDVERRIVLVDTVGTKAGQINGLSLVERGGFRFGRPARITARVHLGQGRVTDIEREANLGGPLHSKGVMILWGYLAGRYAQEVPLALAATLVFEQSYAAVEGDSASAAELFALLSALADAPLKQGIAVTGSVNQWGDVQAVGGVNEKIEGFYDVCAARGLSGSQGVLIPDANRQHLMLREDIVSAVREKRFSVTPIKTVDEGMTLLTGLEAGERGADSRFGAETLNGRIEAKLRTFAERARAFGPGARDSVSSGAGRA